MTNSLRLLRIALSYFTRIPMGKVEFDTRDLSRAIHFFPGIGYLVAGLPLLLVYFVEGYINGEILMLAFLVLSALLTGALHEDGFADYCDGFGGGYTRDRILEIMSDPRLGTYGVLGLLFLCLSKFYLLLDLWNSALPFFLTVMAGAVLSRTAAISLTWFLPYARLDQGSVAAEVKPKSPLLGISFALLAMVPIALLLPQNLLIVLPLGTIIVTLIQYFFLKSKLGGYTGDCMGAHQQFVELLIYFLVYIFWSESV